MNSFLCFFSRRADRLRQVRSKRSFEASRPKNLRTRSSVAADWPVAVKSASISRTFSAGMSTRLAARCQKSFQLKTLGSLARRSRRFFSSVLRSRSVIGSSVRRGSSPLAMITTAWPRPSMLAGSITWVRVFFM